MCLLLCLGVLRAVLVSVDFLIDAVFAVVVVIRGTLLG